MPNRKTKESYWYKAQQLVAQLEDGEVVIASGARPGYKGDVITDEYLIEVKSSENRLDYRITTKLLDKMEQEANGVGKVPLLYIVLQQKGVLRCEPCWACSFDEYDAELFGDNTGLTWKANYWDHADGELYHANIGSKLWAIQMIMGPISAQQIARLL